MLLNCKQCHKNVTEKRLHFNVCLFSLLTFEMVLMTDVGINESLLSSFVCE